MSIYVSLWLVFFIVEAMVFIFYYLYLKWVISKHAGFEKDSVNLIDEMPTVLLCIPTFNEEKNITRKLENTIKLTYPKEKLHVVVIDDSSTDSTVQLAKDFICKHPDSIRIICKERRRGKPDTIALFLSIPAEAEILGITDADIMLERDTLAKVVANFTDQKVGAVSIGSVVNNEMLDTLTTRCEKAYRNLYMVFRIGESLLHSTPLHAAALMLFRKGLVNNIRSRTGSPEIAIGFEIIKKGFRTVCDGSTLVYEAPPKCIMYRMQQKARRGKHIAISLIENVGMMFSRRYGSFGTIVFPAEFFMHIVSPVLVTFLLLTVWILLLEPIVFLTLLGFFTLLAVGSRVRTLMLSFLSSQLGLAYGILCLLLGKLDHLY